MDLATFSDHVNNRATSDDININVCNDDAICNNIPAVSHEQNIDLIGEYGAENNTVKLQRAAENVVNCQPSNSSFSMPVQPSTLIADNRVDDVQIDNGPTIPSMADMAALLNRISVIETQAAWTTLINENLQLRINALEQRVKHFIDTSPLSLLTISVQQNSFDPLLYQFGEGDALIGTFSIFKSLGQQRHRTARTHGDVVTRCKSQTNAGLKNSGKLCYSNAILQAFESCNHRTTLFDDPPQQNQERIPLCYEFAKVLHLMVNNQLGDQDVVDPSDLIILFLVLHSDFVDRECEYC